MVRECLRKQGIYTKRQANTDPERRKLTVQNLKTGEIFIEDCNILITARGQLNNMSWPNIPGLDKFQGKIMHSGQWDES